MNLQSNRTIELSLKRLIHFQSQLIHDCVKDKNTPTKSDRRVEVDLQNFDNFDNNDENDNKIKFQEKVFVLYNESNRKESLLASYIGSKLYECMNYIDKVDKVDVVKKRLINVQSFQSFLSVLSKDTVDTPQLLLLLSMLMETKLIFFVVPDKEKTKEMKESDIERMKDDEAIFDECLLKLCSFYRDIRTNKENKSISDPIFVFSTIGVSSSSSSSLVSKNLNFVKRKKKKGFFFTKLNLDRYLLDPEMGFQSQSEVGGKKKKTKAQFDTLEHREAKAVYISFVASKYLKKYINGNNNNNNNNNKKKNNNSNNKKNKKNSGKSKVALSLRIIRDLVFLLYSSDCRQLEHIKAQDKYQIRREIVILIDENEHSLFFKRSSLGGDEDEDKDEGDSVIEEGDLLRNSEFRPSIQNEALCNLYLATISHTMLMYSKKNLNNIFTFRLENEMSRLLKENRYREEKLVESIEQGHSVFRSFQRNPRKTFFIWINSGSIDEYFERIRTQQIPTLTSDSEFISLLDSDLISTSTSTSTSTSVSTSNSLSTTITPNYFPRMQTPISHLFKKVIFDQKKVYYFNTDDDDKKKSSKKNKSVESIWLPILPSISKKKKKTIPSKEEWNHFISIPLKLGFHSFLLSE